MLKFLASHGESTHLIALYLNELALLFEIMNPDLAMIYW
jgi:hypothetical protein